MFVKQLYSEEIINLDYVVKFFKTGPVEIEFRFVDGSKAWWTYKNGRLRDEAFEDLEEVIGMKLIEIGEPIEP